MGDSRVIDRGAALRRGAYSASIGALAAALALMIPTTALAQRGYGGDYSDVIIIGEPEEVTPPTVPAPPATIQAPTPVSTPAPAPIPVTAQPAPLPPTAKAKLKKPEKENFAFEDPALDAVTSPVLQRFTSDRDFRAYRSSLDKIKKRRRPYWMSNRAPRYQYAFQDAPLCTPGVDCPEEEDASNIVVTGARAPSPPRSMATPVTTVGATNITNVQTANVDEGDIVKQIGSYLLILQDGRIFSVDTKDKGLTLTDRMNIYRNSKSETWYDEMLVEGNHVIVTAYSYGEDASEISVFALDQQSGKLSREGVFLISSDDYYDADNYATRIVGDKLIIYTPYEVEEMDSVKTAPTIRRWLPEEEHEDEQAKGRPLFRAEDVYRPVQRTSAPTIHTVSICQLGDMRMRHLACRSEAIVGPEKAEMFVSPDNIFLWVSPGWSELDRWKDDECAANVRASARDVIPSAVFRIPVGKGDVTVAGVRGQPFDQFSMDSRDREFRALSAWRNFRCEADGEASTDVAYLTVPDRLFSNEFYPVSDNRFIATPTPGGRAIENRFADDWLVYGGRNGWRSRAPDEGEPALSANLVVLPVKKPQDAKMVALLHNIIRIERLGADLAVVNGYRDSTGLSTSLIDFAPSPHVASQIHYPGRFESEGRSHAFNATVDTAGEGMFGVPTVARSADSDRWWWNSDQSDLSFVRLSKDRKLSRMGELIADPNPRPPVKNKYGHYERPEANRAPGYTCEVSCIDWYGNSRPIFTGGRIFGLMETNIAEAKVHQGRIIEVQRLDITRPPGATALPPAPPKAAPAKPTP